MIHSVDNLGGMREYSRTFLGVASVITTILLATSATTSTAFTTTTAPPRDAFCSHQFATRKTRWNENFHLGSKKGCRVLLSTRRATRRAATSKTILQMATPRVGLIGLPNVGKSTLFNAVSRTADLARAANFPFCTIEPNKAPIAIPDPFLEDLSRKFVASGPIRPARIELIDVAGLVEGASRGEGLGNKFLAVIRECGVIVHVLRYFKDEDVMRHESVDSGDGGASAATATATTTTFVDPVFDAAIVDNELLLADLAHAEKRLSRIEKQDESDPEKVALRKVLEALRESVPARFAELSKDEEFAIKSMGLLTLKPVVYAFNVDEIEFTAQREQATMDIRTNIMPQIRSNNRNNKNNNNHNNNQGDGDDGSENDDFVLVSAKLEEDLLSLGGPAEQSDYISELMSMGETKDGSDRENNNLSSSLSLEERYQNLLSYNVLPKTVCRLLSLSLCYTGPGVPSERSQTTKSYLFRATSSDSGNDGTDDDKGRKETSLTIFGLAGKIHGELQKGFLRAEVISAGDLLRFDSFREAREEGCVRTEGKDYAIEMGDTVLIKWREG